MKKLSILSNAIILTIAFTLGISNLAFANKMDPVISSDGVISSSPTTNVNDNLYVRVKSSFAEMRSNSDQSSRLVRQLPTDYSLSVLGAEFGWLRVSDDNGETGYVQAEYITFHNGEKPSNKIFELSAKGTNIAEFSKKYLGTPYVWGGTNLNTGVDCSGFIYSVYKNFGINLNRSSKAMYSGNGTSISKSELIPGDLLFFNTFGNGVSHVGMYIGNDQYIHSSGRCVNITSLSSAYSKKTYLGAKRVLA